MDSSKLERQMNKEGQTIILLHYIPYHKEYQEFKNTYKEIDNRLLKTKGVIVAQIDCDEYFDICEKKHLKHLPVMTIIHNKQETVLSSLKVEELRETLKKVSNIEFAKIEDINVITLNQDNYKEILKDGKKHFVKFFAPWCGHCRALKPEFESASRTSKVQFCEVDCDANPKVCAEYDVQSYPTLGFFDKNSLEMKPYEGERRSDALLKYTNDLMSSLFFINGWATIYEK